VNKQTSDNTSKKTFSPSISELMDSLRTSGMDVRIQGSSLVAWVAAWLLICWSECEDRERQAIAEFDGNEYSPLFKEREWWRNALGYDQQHRHMGYMAMYQELQQMDDNPLRMWIQKNIDIEDQRRRAVQEGQE
jgi:hypothetical protein